MIFGVNTSPWAGREGTGHVAQAPRAARARVARNVESRVEDTDQPDALAVSGAASSSSRS
jgi:predicted membrane GTPase involved in stress response